MPFQWLYRLWVPAFTSYSNSVNLYISHTIVLCLLFVVPSVRSVKFKPSDFTVNSVPWSLTGFLFWVNFPTDSSLVPLSCAVFPITAIQERFAVFKMTELTPRLYCSKCFCVHPDHSSTTCAFMLQKELFHVFSASQDRMATIVPKWLRRHLKAILG